MREYTKAEQCMLLLFARLGEEKPLTLRRYRNLRGLLEIVGQAQTDPDGMLDMQELYRIGVAGPEAEQILRRLDMERELEAHLDMLAGLGLTVITRISPEYPRRLWSVLGDRAPMLLYCAGNLELFRTDCVSLVGSRRLREPGMEFAREAGRAAAEQGLTCCSGGAEGADSVAFSAAFEAGGTAILFLPDSLQDRALWMRTELESGRLLLVSEEGFHEAFTSGRAFGRNRLIHAMGRAALAAQSDVDKGGTWQGVTENLKNNWSPAYIYTGEPWDAGVQALLKRGANPVSMADLRDLRQLFDMQTPLY